MQIDVHKILDAAEHLSYYISGVFIILGAALRFWWVDRRSNKRRIVNNEKQYEQLSWLIETKLVTKEHLAECSEEKDDQHREGIKEVLEEVKAIRSEGNKRSEINSQQHQDILAKMTDLHSGDKNRDENG